MTYRLTKSKLQSYRQCQKRLWLEVNRPDLAEVSEATERVFDQGDRVGEIARHLYGAGSLIEFDPGAKGALKTTQQVLGLAKPKPVYEATFQHQGVLVRADVTKPSAAGLSVIEVKSATSVKDVYRDDCAIQAWTIEGAGHRLKSFKLAHVDTSFVYPGNEDYRGLLAEVSMNPDIEARRKAVPVWVRGAKKVLDGNEPDQPIGAHCTAPYECPFIGYCHPKPAEYPIEILPHAGRLIGELQAEGHRDIREIPKGRLVKPLHQRIWHATRTGQVVLEPAALEFASALGFPRYFLDFESISFAVPIWKGTRPYQQLPFQWSCHKESRGGSLNHRAFLDLSGQPPMRDCIEQLLAWVGAKGPIIVYSGFEKMILTKLAEMYQDLAVRIGQVVERLVDLLPVMRAHYYHPQMKGSWSIKSVLPTIAPELDYSDLEEVSNGVAAQDAYLEAIAPATTSVRQNQLQKALLTYCEQDTKAMIAVMKILGA